MAKHARFSPSSLDNLSKCVRFKHIEMEDAANEGQEMHKAFETGDLRGLNEEQTSVVQQSLDYVGSVKAGTDWIEVAEGKVELRELTYGTADRILISQDQKTGHIMDFKAIRVESDHAFQVKTYAAAVLETYPLMKTITTHILAPRLGQGAEVETYDCSLLAAVRAEIETLYARINDPWEPPKPHEDLCGKCANARGCPAIGAVVKMTADLAGLPLPSVFEPSSLVSERDRMVAQVLAMVFINWGDQVKKYNAEYVAEHDGDVPGFRLVTRSTGVRIPRENTATAWAVLKTAFDLSEDELMSAATLSPAELVKVMHATRGGPSAEYKQDIINALGDLGRDGVAKYLQKAKKVDNRLMLESVT